MCYWNGRELGENLVHNQNGRSDKFKSVTNQSRSEGDKVHLSRCYVRTSTWYCSADMLRQRITKWSHDPEMKTRDFKDDFLTDCARLLSTPVSLAVFTNKPSHVQHCPRRFNKPLSLNSVMADEALILESWSTLNPSSICWPRWLGPTEPVWTGQHTFRLPWQRQWDPTWVGVQVTRPWIHIAISKQRPLGQKEDPVWVWHPVTTVTVQRWVMAFQDELLEEQLMIQHLVWVKTWTDVKCNDRFNLRFVFT